MFRWFLLLVNVFGFSPIVRYFPSFSQLFARSKHRRILVPLSIWNEKIYVIFYCCTAAVSADESRKRKLNVSAISLDSFSLNVSFMFHIHHRRYCNKHKGRYFAWNYADDFFSRCFLDDACSVFRLMVDLAWSESCERVCRQISHPHLWRGSIHVIYFHSIQRYEIRSIEGNFRRHTKINQLNDVMREHDWPQQIIGR